MNEKIKNILEGIVNEDYPEIPEFAFSLEDYENVLIERGLEVPGRSTIARRLDNRVKDGELVRLRTPSNRVFYVPAALKKNMELDEDAIKEA